MKEKVKEIIIRTKEGQEIDLQNSNLISDGILDSLDIMNLIMNLESEFDIEIDPEDVLSENFESVERIVELIEKCKN